VTTTTTHEYTLASLRTLPPTIPVATADDVLGIGATLSKRLRASGRYPVRILPGIGRHHRVSTADLLAYLGIALDGAPAAPVEADAATGTSASTGALTVVR
jgi:hypothetical protein